MSGKEIYEAIDLVKDKYIDEVYTLQNKNNVSFSKKKLYSLLLAATMVIAMLTACAAEMYKWDGRLSQVLNLSSEQQTYVDGMWYSINETKTVKGITVTLDSVLADDNSMLLLYDVTLPESMDMDRYYNFEINQIDSQEWFSFGGSISGGTKTSIVKIDKKNHTISYLMEYSADSGSLKEQKMRFWFNDLRSYKIIDDAIADERLERAVDFVFYSDITYTPNVLNYSLDKQISGLLNTVKVEHVTITPISLTIKASGESKVTLWNIEKDEHEKSFVSAVISKDGTKIELSDSGTGVSNKTVVSYKTMFREIINPKDVVAIEFFEKERVSLEDLQYTTKVESILSRSQISKIISEICIFISLISMSVSAIATLHFCKSDIYKYFEKIQSKRQKKGKEYTLDDFCSSHKRKMMIIEIGYIFFSIILLLGVCRLTFLIISNWFVTMTVFMDALCIGLIFLMVVTIKESRKKRKYLETL
jgi:Domain of unknown function (DUF4179)